MRKPATMKTTFKKYKDIEDFEKLGSNEKESNGSESGLLSADLAIKPQEEEIEPKKDLYLGSERTGDGDTRPGVVGVGASAGGLEALETFFKYVETDTGLAFVVLHRLSSDYKSLLLDLFAKHTLMPARLAKDGDAVEGNSIYLIPPKKNLIIKDGFLRLIEQGDGKPLDLPVDVFFQSLAEDQGERAVGVILSGAGCDGVAGCRAIKSAGGIVLVQDVASAKFDGMPRGVIASGASDYIMPPAKMGAQLNLIVGRPAKYNGDPATSNLSDERMVEKILEHLRSKTGNDFSFYKPNTIMRRIERRVNLNQLEGLAAYYDLLSRSALECDTLHKELLIGVTKFFRDKEAFKAVEQKVIPAIFANKQDGAPVRIWSSGCSTGEEAYTLAMIILDYMEMTGIQREVKIFATDLDKNAIDFASLGVYPDSISDDVGEKRIVKYFMKLNRAYRINDNVRRLVIFATHNILKDPPFTKIDLAVCRNLLIYLQPSMQKKALSAFNLSLVESGFLFLGTSESLGSLSYLFNTYDSKWKIFVSASYSKVGSGESLYEGVTSTAVVNASRPSIQFGSLWESDPELTKSISNALIENIAPPLMVLDESGRAVYASGDLLPFLRSPFVEMPLGISPPLHPDLMIAFSAALRKAQNSGAAAFYEDIQIGSLTSGYIHLNLTIKPFKASNLGQMLHIATFEKIESKRELIKSANESLSISEDFARRVEELEIELASSKFGMQSTIEELTENAKELQETSEQRLRSIIESAPVGLCITDEFGFFEYVNDSYCDIFKYERDELIGKHFTMVVDNDIKQIVDESHRNFFRRKKADRQEWQVQSKSGETLKVVVDAALIKGLDGRPKKATFVLDVTHVKKQEEILRETDERYRMLAENAQDMIFRFSFQPEPHFDYVSPSSIKIFGYSPEEFYADPKIIDGIYEHLSAFALRPINYHSVNEGWTLKLRTKSGSFVWVESRGTVIRNGDGEAIGIEGAARDITERKRTEILQEGFTLVLESIALGASINSSLDLISLTIEELNPDLHPFVSVLDPVDYSLELLSAPHFDALFKRVFLEIPAYDPIEASKFTQGICIWVKETDPFHPVLKALKKVLIEGGYSGIRILPLMNGENKLIGSIGLLYLQKTEAGAGDDFLLKSSARIAKLAIEKRQADMQLIKAKEEAELANRAKSEFLANISHEIRTPMNAILGFAEALVSRENSSRKVKEYARSIQLSGKNLLALINDLLDLSKIESGKLVINFEAIDIPSILLEMRQIFTVMLSEKGIGMRVEIKNSLPALNLDEARLRQILFNLIGNAVKFTEKGEVVVSAFSTNIRENELDLLITVADTGIGIPKDQYDKIFEPFVQRDGQNTRKYGGAGLGLSISRRLAELMGGRIELQSEVGSGSVFSLILPDLVITSISHRSEKRGKEEETHDPTFCLNTFEEANIDGLPGDFIESLERDFSIMWETANSTMLLSEIKNFAIALDEFAEVKKFEPLRSYSDELIRNIDSLDVERIMDILRLYPKIIEFLARKK